MCQEWGPIGVWWSSYGHATERQLATRQGGGHLCGHDRTRPEVLLAARQVQTRGEEARCEITGRACCDGRGTTGRIRRVEDATPSWREGLFVKGTNVLNRSRSQIATLNNGRGQYIKYRPNVFTERVEDAAPYHGEGRNLLRPHGVSGTGGGMRAQQVAPLPQRARRLLSVESITASLRGGVGSVV